MKKLVLGALLMMSIIDVASAKATYECWMYKGGHPQWYVNVRADNNSEAQSLAAIKFEKIGRSGDYIKCH